ncbi:hypothetical protein [Tepidimicrobium xylanilyticum]|uniref:Spo0E like sporulation regulatory protein n=1 Tax=Tepidimicrobium xylanilyticum TaxID=1123352 RepID=A0A1H3C9B9_9FIRM|nr:hypothetical protein [Tepidimicrobium xylanilyticum]GMG98103.1 hypothetical protein EN5CB1_29290 [Tepidimicrobium xylanilyticum]SDX50757.1 hypothetical protein SAMN05660923_02426 [Tepidimicrobium xylanilyticum]
MIFRINKLRNKISEQLNREETDWQHIERLSKELDLLILEYLHNKEKLKEK